MLSRGLKFVQRHAVAALLAGVALGVAAPARADAIDYVFQNTTFNDGTTASGSFVFDTVTDTISNVSVVQSSGSTVLVNWDSGTWLTDQYGYDGLYAISFSSSTAAYSDLTIYMSPDTFPGLGSVPLVQLVDDGTGTFYCTPNCDAHLSGLPEGTSAAIYGTLVPEPMTAALLAPAALFVATRRRRRIAA